MQTHQDFFNPLRVLIVVWAFSLAVSASAQTQFLPGDTASGPAIGTQSAPDIAAGGGQFLAVWQDLRTSPLAGPPFATEARGFDIYGLRLDSNGDPIDSAPFVIARPFGDQASPRVAWNGSNWLVVWGSPNSTAFNHKIDGARIAPDGTILDNPPIAIQNTQYDAKFALTANGAEWAVIWQSTGAGEADIRAVRVGPTGVVLNPGGTQLLPTATSLYNINIVSAQGEYLMLWGNSSSGPQAQRFDATFSPIGSPFLVSSLNATSNGSEYFQVWAVSNGVNSQRLSAAGVPGPVVTVAGGGSALPLANPAQLDASWDGANWWASWLETTRGMVYARVTPSDSVLDFGGVPADPSAPQFGVREIAISGGTAGGAIALWGDERVGGAFPRDIHAAAITGAGSATPRGPINSSAPAQTFLDFAAGDDGAGGDQILAVFLSEKSGDRAILGVRLDSSGNAIDPQPFEIMRDPSAGSPHVAFDGTRYMVVWGDGSQVFAKRILPSGSILDATPLTVTTGQFPSVAGANGTFLVVVTQPTISVQFMHPFSVRVDGATGANLDPSPVLLGQYFARYPRAAWVGSRWLVTWQRNPTHDNPNNSIWAAFVETSGTTAGEFSVMTGGTPEIAFGNDRALIVSRTNSPSSSFNDIIGRLVLSDGTFVGADFPVSNGPRREIDPSVAWNGSEFVVAWSDKRDEVIYSDARTEVFAARVNPDGTVVDSAAFSVGDTADQEIHSAVAGVAGRTIIAASSFRDEPSLQSYRIVYNVMGGSPAGNPWPVAAASAAPSSGDIPLSVTFDSSGSSDAGGIAGFAWNFGDGAAGIGPSPSHTYETAGNYLAELTVTDNQGASTRNTARVIATAVNQPPVAVASANRTSGPAPLSIVYQAAGSYDPDDGIQQLFWTFGDGGTYFGGTAFHTYSTEGTFVTTLTVTDTRGASATATVTITVGPPNQPPVAVASATPTSGISPLTVNFNSAGSSDAEGAIGSYLWQFGDGQSSTAPNPSHVYQNGGVFTATLTVTDLDGATGSDTVQIDVTQGDIANYSNADISTNPGIISAGSFRNTQALDGGYEELTETQSSGNPSKRKSQLSHTWAFNVISGTSYGFVVTAHHSANTENDDFAFAYSRDGSTFTPLLVVTNTAPSGTPQSVAFPEDVAGTLFIRVADTDNTNGNSSVDTLFVDEMAVITSFVAPPPPPPPPPLGDPTSVHVASIVLATVNAGQGKKAGQAEVTLMDDLGGLVANAQVAGSFSGAFPEPGKTATTNAAGVAVFTTTGSQKGSVSFGFCVDDVVAAGLTYDPASNVETCDVF